MLDDEKLERMQKQTDKQQENEEKAEIARDNGKLGLNSDSACPCCTSFDLHFNRILNDFYCAACGIWCGDYKRKGKM